jgi:hypothetical protein
MSKRGLRLMGMVLGASIVSATASVAQIPDLAGTLEARRAETAEVIVWNRPVVVLRAAIGGVSPEERAEAIRRRIEELPLEGAEIRAERKSPRADRGSRFRGER